MQELLELRQLLEEGCGQQGPPGHALFVYLMLFGNIGKSMLQLRNCYWFYRFSLPCASFSHNRYT